MMEDEVRPSEGGLREVNLQEWIKKKSRNPAFRSAYQAASERHALALALATMRKRQGVSQAEMARRLRTSQQAISRIENPTYEGHTTRTVLEYAAALGRRVEVRFLDSAGLEEGRLILIGQSSRAGRTGRVGAAKRSRARKAKSTVKRRR